MSMIRPLWDHVRTQARLRPAALAVHGPAGPTPYATLVAEVEAVATELMEQGLSPRDMVGLHLGFSHLHLLLILALDRLSIPSMSFAVADASQAPVVDPRFRLTAVISGLAAPADVAGRWIRMTEPDRPRPGAIDAARLGRLDGPPDAVVRIAWSSGTTGGPKGAVITRATLAHRLMVRRLVGGLSPRTRYFTGMPFSVASSHETALAVLAAGGAVILPAAAPDFVGFANALGVTLTTGTPALLAELVDGGGRGARRLDSVRAFDVIGAHVPAELARRARLELTPHITIAYGASEAGRIATGDVTLGERDPGVIGAVIPWTELEVVDAADRPVPAGREGVLRVRGPQTVAGYLDDATATQRNFRDGWFYPGDVGLLTGDRLLRLTGRIEELIRHGGELVSPVPIEEALRGVAGVRDAAVFTLPEPGGALTCAALVLAPGAAPAAVRSEVAVRLGDRVPQRLFVVEQLPRNAAGKVVRRELAEMARQE
ncbi:MAG: long-chain fatty acid--CoA ligase, partial [Alphaproteobacteria bacterium]|nr:long-chain fatty acid--CoA ligase [Alphaproteobacteria bacterium]